jgi:GLPGLI family protein
MIKHFFLFNLAFGLLATVATAQNTDSKPLPIKLDSTDGYRINYEITRRVDGQNIKMVVVTDGNAGGAEPDLPATITLNQTVGIFATGASLGEPQMPMPKGMDDDGAERVIIRPVQETMGMDFEKREFTRSMRSSFDPEKKSYYFTEPLTTPKDWKEAKKTKKIAGFECKKATCTFEEAEYTVWYTTELPGTFSPLSNVFPPNGGVVLGLESDDQAYITLSIDQQVRVAKPANITEDAIKLTPAEMKAKRREFTQKAMSEGGNIRIRRNK